MVPAPPAVIFTWARGARSLLRFLHLPLELLCSGNTIPVQTLISSVCSRWFEGCWGGSGL